MSRSGEYWLAVVFVLLAAASATGLVLLVGGHWRVTSEALGLLVGAGLAGAIWLGLRRR